MMRSGAWLLLSAVGLGWGCGGPQEDVSQDEPPADSEGLISQTIIRQQPDGALTQETVYITREEQQAQMEAREEYLRQLQSGTPRQLMANLIIDSGCAGSSLWLFDQVGFTGRQLCLYKNPSETYAFIDLGTVIRYIAPTYPIQRIYFWTGAVKSLWSGVDAGNLATCDNTRMACYSNGPYVPFSAYQKVDNVPSGTVIGGTMLGPNTVFLEN
ncbi:hypothetical protein [Vitiosangium sp. GDMCC 1.1324]|uniref:hypothetical protein n=1 Tax=Vitiosangium sp. (strain GDMCC 1.1324) TaxID=2138576 RepID=UPI000D3B0CC4|nr:hypothetical protein [Vitiosangium sp. GDMCC 1.1324]PTL81589.1 hypothetical protein DAT35_21765 [Vitiosangium sp. GDMCC 1.1324]